MKTLVLFLTLLHILVAKDALPSWQDHTAKQSIIKYVSSVIKKGSKEFIPVQDRIAVFDNDGTLWSERPIYFQLQFAFDRVKTLAPQHPKWKKQEPFKSVLSDDLQGILKSGMKGLEEIVTASHGGMDVDTSQKLVKEWVGTAKNSKKNRHYNELIFQPMMELVSYLNQNDFTVYIVSGGGIDFMRAFIPEKYGIPKEHIIGSYGKAHFKDGKIIKDGGLVFNDDKSEKPVAIYRNIGKRPVMAFGNSDGDLEMLQYTDANKKYKTFQLYVHHTDDVREWAYDRKSMVGKFDKGLDYAKEHKWAMVDMKNDWRVIYPFELSK